MHFLCCCYCCCRPWPNIFTYRVRGCPPEHPMHEEDDRRGGRRQIANATVAMECGLVLCRVVCGAFAQVSILVSICAVYCRQQQRSPWHYSACARYNLSEQH